MSRKWRRSSERLAEEAAVRLKYYALPCVAALLAGACALQNPPSQAPAGPGSVHEANEKRETVLPLALEGVLRQGEMLLGRVAPGTAVSVGGRDVRVAADGTFVFGLDRDAVESVAIRVAHPDGRVREETYPVERREYDIQRVSGIAERIMKPSEADRRRIAEDAAKARAARERDDPRTDFRQAFIWPAQGRVSGVYGSQRYYNDVPGNPHYGVDVAVPTGTPVVAPADGVVTLAHPDMFYSGGTLIIDHGHGISSTLMHLSALLVREGETVRQGQRVALSGATGRASGPHLDWRMNWFTDRIDPVRLVPPMPSAPANPAMPSPAKTAP